MFRDPAKIHRNDIWVQTQVLSYYKMMTHYHNLNIFYNTGKMLPLKFEECYFENNLIICPFFLLSQKSASWQLKGHRSVPYQYQNFLLHSWASTMLPGYTLSEFMDAEFIVCYSQIMLPTEIHFLIK